MTHGTPMSMKMIFLQQIGKQLLTIVEFDQRDISENIIW